MGLENEKLKAFLQEIKAVSEKYGLYINDESCGCCGHTHVVDGENKRQCENMWMYYDSEKKEYAIEPTND